MQRWLEAADGKAIELRPFVRDLNQSTSQVGADWEGCEGVG